MPGELGCGIVAVDGGGSMAALRWVLNDIKLRSPAPDSAKPSYPSAYSTRHHPQSRRHTRPFGGRCWGAGGNCIISEDHRGDSMEICAGKNGITEVLIGDPKEKICEAVEDFRADLLLMGSRAFGPMERWELLRT